MLLVIKLAAVVGLVASSANWVAFDADSKSADAARSHAHAQGQQVTFHQASLAQMPINICQSSCNFLSILSLAH